MPVSYISDFIGGMQELPPAGPSISLMRYLYCSFNNLFKTLD